MIKLYKTSRLRQSINNTKYKMKSNVRNLRQKPPFERGQANASAFDGGLPSPFCTASDPANLRHSRCSRHPLSKGGFPGACVFLPVFLIINVFNVRIAFYVVFRIKRFERGLGGNFP